MASRVTPFGGRGRRSPVREWVRDRARAPGGSGRARRLRLAASRRRHLGARDLTQLAQGATEHDRVRDSGDIPHGEGDLLPSLVVDRYGDYLVVQALSQGVDRLLPDDKLTVKDNAVTLTVQAGTVRIVELR